MADDQSSNCRSLAHNMHVEKKSINTVPCVWGTSIKIQMSSPFYVVFLLIGIFFTSTVCGSLAIFIQSWYNLHVYMQIYTSLPMIIRCSKSVVIHVPDSIDMNYSLANLPTTLPV